MRPSSCLLLTTTLLGCLALTPGAGAATVNIGASADASLFEFIPNNNFGAAIDLPAGSLGSERGNTARNRALYQFDLTGQIPNDAVIESVTLTLYANIEPPSASGSEFFLHRVLKGWGEGTGTANQGAAALAGEVTWNSRAHGSDLWTVPGGEAGTDYASTSSSSTFVSGLGFHLWASTPQMIADVQHWLQNPTDNFGWIIISGSEDTPYTAKRFASREYGGDPNALPRLQVQYTVIPEPTTLGLGALALAGALGWRRWRA